MSLFMLNILSYLKKKFCVLGAIPWGCLSCHFQSLNRPYPQFPLTQRQSKEYMVAVICCFVKCLHFVLGTKTML